MQKDRPEIVFTFPIALGGVSSFNFNIINNSKLLKNFNSKVILIKRKQDERPQFTELFNVDEQIIFEMSDFENQYHLQKRLNNLIGKNAGAIVTDNGLTMEAARRFHNPKTVFSLLHDYFYVNQQIKLNGLADVAIAHSSFFSDAVFASDPALWVDRTFYIPYGVQQLPKFPQKKTGNINAVFLGRLENSKGVLKLFEIQQQLALRNIKVNWTIIGKGELKNTLVKQWENETVSFYEPNATAEVYEIMKGQDIMVFPTSFEGTPVAILEAISCGVVPIVNDLPGGIRDIITGAIGFRIKANATEAYAEIISHLSLDKTALMKMQQCCYALANEHYNIENNADDYLELFLKYKELARTERSSVRLLNKLNHSFIPNWITQKIRTKK